MNKKTIISIIILILLSCVSFFVWQKINLDSNKTPSILPEIDKLSTCTNSGGIWNPDTNTCFADDGDVYLEIEKAKTPETQKYQKYLQESKAFDPIIEDINNSFAFPYDITVIFKNCDESNAFYYEDTKSITMCYELMEDVNNIYADSWLTWDDLEAVVFNNMLATLFHELWHAFIDIYKLPITWREEDVADQISTYILLETYDGWATAVLDAAEEYYVNHDKNPVEWKGFADVHTSDLARYYNLVCRVYGSDESQFSGLLEDTWITDDRASWCAEEYNKFKKSLNMLLLKFTKIK